MTLKTKNIKKYSEIKKVFKIRFEKSVIKYSISLTQKITLVLLGGLTKIRLTNPKAIEEIGIGEISDPIIMPSGAIILKLSDKKIVDADINLEKELKN